MIGLDSFSYHHDQISILDKRSIKIDHVYVNNSTILPEIENNHSWSRYKYGYDTDNFLSDFYNEPNPTPGRENSYTKSN